MASIDGRAMILNIPANPKEDFPFKCHRNGNDAYQVNAISWHPSGSFATAGGNGEICVWDKFSRSRVKQLTDFPDVKPGSTPVVATQFNSDGTLLAYGIGYDWYKGHKFASEYRNSLFIHKVDVNSITPKKK